MNLGLEHFKAMDDDECKTDIDLHVEDRENTNICCYDAHSKLDKPEGDYLSSSKINRFEGLLQKQEMQEPMRDDTPLSESMPNIANSLTEIKTQLSSCSIFQQHVEVMDDDDIVSSIFENEDYETSSKEDFVINVEDFQPLTDPRYLIEIDFDQNMVKEETIIEYHEALDEEVEQEKKNKLIQRPEDLKSQRYEEGNSEEESLSGDDFEVVATILADGETFKSVVGAAFECKPLEENYSDDNFEVLWSKKGAEIFPLKRSLQTQDECKIKQINLKDSSKPVLSTTFECIPAEENYSDDDIEVVSKANRNEVQVDETQDCPANSMMDAELIPAVLIKGDINGKQALSENPYSVGRFTGTAKHPYTKKDAETQTTETDSLEDRNTKSKESTGKNQILLSNEIGLKDEGQLDKQFNELLSNEIGHFEKIHKAQMDEMEAQIKDLLCKNTELKENMKYRKDIEQQMISIKSKNNKLELENQELRDCKGKYLVTHRRCANLQEEVYELLNEMERMRYDFTIANNASQDFINILLKHAEKDSLAEECTELRLQNEDIKMNVEYLAEKVTGSSMQGKSVAKMIDHVASCFLDLSNHARKLEKELILVRTGRASSRNSDGEEYFEDELYQVREYCRRLESQKSKQVMSNKEVGELLNECAMIKRERDAVQVKLQEKDDKNKELYRANGELWNKQKVLTEQLRAEGVIRDRYLDTAFDLANQFVNQKRLSKESCNEEHKKMVNQGDANQYCTFAARGPMKSDDLKLALFSKKEHKDNVHVARKELLELEEIKSLINTKNIMFGVPKRSLSSESDSLNKEKVKNAIISIINDYQLAGINDDSIQKLIKKNEAIRTRLAAYTEKNEELQNQLAHFALRERYYIEVQKRFEKTNTERITFKCKIKYLTERLRKYDESSLQNESSFDLVHQQVQNEGDRLHYKGEELTNLSTELNRDWSYENRSYMAADGRLALGQMESENYLKQDFTNSIHVAYDA